MLEPSVILSTVVAAIAFSAAASAMYIVNDVVDLERDRVHPRKQLRPLAAGTISTSAALVVAGLLAAAALILSATVATALLSVIGIYLVLTTLYSVGLKHVAVVDIVVVASGFVLRAVAGGVAADVPISSWFLIVTSFGALFVVTGKRYGELTSLSQNGVSHRPSLDDYTPEYLRYVLTFSSGLAAIAYCLWAFEVPRTGTSQLLMQLSIVPFITALLRYGHIIMQGRAGEPEEVFLRDRELLLLGLVWLTMFGVGVTIG